MVSEPPLGIRVLGLISTLGKSRPVSLRMIGELISYLTNPTCIYQPCGFLHKGHSFGADLPLWT